MQVGDIVPYVTVEHMDGRMRLRPSPAMITGYSEDEEGPMMDLKVFHRGGGIENIHNVRSYDHESHGWRAGAGRVYADGFGDLDTEWQDIPEANEDLQAPDRPRWTQPAEGGPMRRETPEEVQERLRTKPGPKSPARGFEATTGQAEINKNGPLPSQTAHGPNEQSAPEPGPSPAPGSIQSTDSSPISEPGTFNPPSGGGGASVTSPGTEDAGHDVPQIDPQGGPQGGTAKARG